MIKKFNDLTIFIDDECIEDVKFKTPSSKSGRLLVYYTLTGDLDDSKEMKFHPLMDSGNNTLKKLKELALSEINRRKKL